MTNRLPGKKRIVGRIVVLLAILLVIILLILADWIQKWLWMLQVGYVSVFWTLLAVRWEMFSLAFLASFLFLWVNMRIAARNATVLRATDETGGFFSYRGNGSVHVTAAGIRALLVVVAAAIALIFGAVFYPQWDTWLRFRFGGSFGLSDPLYGADAGFYLFRLPFYELLQNSLTGLTLLTLIISVAAYLYFGVLQFSRGWHSERHGRAVPHLSILLLSLVASWAWGFYLDRFELLYSTLGVVYGAGYTADHVNRIALWVMVGASAALGVVLLFNYFRAHLRTLLLSLGGYVALYLLALGVLPALVQKLMVLPNELQLESPYLARNIDFTRRAYQLDAIREVSYPALADLTEVAVANNEDTIQNVRLWDWRPLLQTYRQTQEIRLYYQFYNVDVDRYRLEDGYHQVMLSARELSAELPAKAQTWVNKYLQFTHGYGVVMSFVAKIVGGGFPQYLLEDIPPRSAYGLTVSQPAIYYGEAMAGYRIVDTGTEEFDYPKGNQNVYTRYHGRGGILLDSFWKRLLFSWTQSDVNILLTSYLTPQSRIQIWRRVGERVAQVAPFLRLDGDPYAVLSEGRLYWIQDAYTVSDRYPYSTPYTLSTGESLNYIRNSVKVLVDMYDGTVSFYVMDPGDPVLAVYRRAFPGVFLDLDRLSADLRVHLRYPEDLFAIQADQYKSFHMTVPQVYYNQEDLWVSPQEKYAGSAIAMRPYYILMRLPGTEDLQYLLMTPFTPQNRDNMIAWMAARCDLPEYGKILVYQLPKEKLVYGPIQIEAMIDQNAVISEQLSLWDQRGSRVIRGNLIVIPIDESFLYVEPVYLTAEGTNIPQLIRVIAVSGDKVVMEPALDQAIQALFGGQAPPQPVSQAPATQPRMELAKTLFEQAQKAMEQGDWAKFGQAMEALKRLFGSTGSDRR